MAERIRLDKWLWHARFFKSRTLASDFVAGAHVRVNGQPVAKPATAVGPSDMLTLRLGTGAHPVRLIRVLACGVRRGPAPEAQALYRDETGGGAHHP